MILGCSKCYSSKIVHEVHFLHGLQQCETLFGNYYVNSFINRSSYSYYLVFFGHHSTSAHVRTRLIRNRITFQMNKVDWEQQLQHENRFRIYNLYIGIFQNLHASSSADCLKMGQLACSNIILHGTCITPTYDLLTH